MCDLHYAWHSMHSTHTYTHTYTYIHIQYVWNIDTSMTNRLLAFVDSSAEDPRRRRRGPPLYYG